MDGSITNNCGYVFHVARNRHVIGIWSIYVDNFYTTTKYVPTNKNNNNYNNIENLCIEEIVEHINIIMYCKHLVGPSTGWLGKQIFKFRLKIAVRTDERGRLMNEIISGIQVIKMYTWEKLFVDNVDYSRMYMI